MNVEHSRFNRSNEKEQNRHRRGAENAEKTISLNFLWFGFDNILLYNRI